MARRGNGEGSIYQRKSTGRWEASITLEDGTRKTFYGKTRTEVKDKLKKAMADQQQGLLVKSDRQTVGQFLTDWLENTHRRRVRPRTYERYREAINLHIIPAIGDHQLQKLTAQHIQAFYTAKEKEGLAPATIRYYHSVLHNAFTLAVKWGLIARNICDLTSPPRRERHEMHTLSFEQAQRFLDTLAGHKWEALFELALATGLRRGEILALKWQDIDFDAGTLQVRRILSRVPTQSENRQHVYVEAEPKTHMSRRSVVIASFALEALEKHRANQAEEKQKAGQHWQNYDYVFCTSTGTHLNPNYIVDVFKKLLQRAGLPNLRFHDLRHSAATLLFKMKTHPKIVQELLGYSNISITLDIYSHTLPGMQEDAIQGLDEAFKKIQNPGKRGRGRGQSKRQRTQD